MTTIGTKSGNRRLITSVAMIVGLALCSQAQAANWFKLRGTEPGGISHTLQVWGFLQPTFAHDYGDEIKGPGTKSIGAARGGQNDGAVFGLAGGGKSLPFAGSGSGTTSVPTTIPPDRVSDSSFYMRRARIGIRGTMLPISNDVDYFILTEWGQNGVTRGGGAAHLLDASVTLNHLSRGVDEDGLANLGARVRMGQFLFSQTSQALSQSTPGRRVHIFMPDGTLAFALRRPVNDNAPGNFSGDVSVNGARDVGIEIFDWAEFKDPIFKSGGPLEFTYSYGLGNGDTIGELDRDSNFRHYGWLSISKLWDNTRGPRRHDMTLYGFYQKGDIKFNNDVNGDGSPDDSFAFETGVKGVPQTHPLHGLLSSDGLTRYIDPVNAGLVDADRILNAGNAKDEEQKYWGVGFGYFDKPFPSLGQMRFEAEYQRQTGLIFDGVQSPSVLYNGSGAERLGLRYIPNGESDAWHVDVGYDVHKHLGLKNRTTVNVRYDTFNRAKDNVQREITLDTWTVTMEHFLHKKGRFTLSYQFRDGNADDRCGVNFTTDLAVSCDLATSDMKFRQNGNAVLEGLGHKIGLQYTLIYKNVLLR